MTALLILKEARALIEDPSHWTQGELARDADGCLTEVLSPSAVCWCSIGALEKVSTKRTAAAERRASDVLYEAGKYLFPLHPEGFHTTQRIARVNDNQSHAEVLAVFDDAIAKEQEQC